MPLIPFLTNSAPGAAIYAPASGGGGGGGGGNNQNISSITTSSILFSNGPGDGVNPYVLNIYGQGSPSEVAFNNGGISAPTPAAVYTGLYASTLVNALSGSYAGCFFATQDPGGVNSQLVMGSIINDGNVIASTDQNRNTAPLNIIANPLSVSSLVVSSINGATPGGGGGAGPNLTISTLTTNVAGYIDAPAIGGSLRLEQDGSVQGAHLLYISTGVNTSELQFSPSSIIANNTSFQVSNPTAGLPLVIEANDTNLYSLGVPGQASIEIGVIGGRKQMYANVAQANDLMVSTIISPGGKGVNILDDLSVSSIINVSSINGAAYPPSGASAQKLTWLNSGTNTLPSGGSPGTFVALTNASAAVTNGHTYRVTANFGLSNTVADGITDIVITGSGIGGLPATIAAIPNIVTGSNVPFGGYSGYFTVAGTSGGGVTVSGVNTGSANTTIQGDNAFVILEDLGTI